HIIHLKNDFYRDGYNKILICMGLIVAAILLLIACSLYLYFSKPKPIYFLTNKDWRVLPQVSLNQSYLPSSELLQWVGDVTRNAFYYDFINYDDQILKNRKYFTDKGWVSFEGMLKNYAPRDLIEVDKVFINGSPGAAPFIINEGLLDQTYAWWVQIPVWITYNYASKQKSISKKQIVFQFLVVRVPTVNNIYGVAIDNIKILTKNKPRTMRT
ncbi:DotI/IcmL/TraM family protein, partial [Gammaproteobacteria bacterium]|nr:DotI/IcmL/TraM family protein [Gammaproteobacteria bacterium]